jgi:hypothetical protein
VSALAPALQLSWPACSAFLQEGQPDRFCYGNQKALDLFECT